METVIATTRQLIASGLTERGIARAVGRGDLVRVRRGLYVPRETHPSIVSAVRLGSVACVSALKIRGVWTMPHGDLHVRAGRNSKARAVSGMRVHRRGATPRVAVEAPVDALGQLLRCADDLDVIVAADSVLQLNLATIHELEQALAGTRRGRRILSRLDARAESGIESIVRVRLRARGVRLRTQVHIRGVGRVDLLIGDRLVVELDGREWHDRASTFESDRKRDAALVVRGYLVMRFSYNRVIDEWNAIEHELLSVIRRDRHVARGNVNRHPNA